MYESASPDARCERENRDNERLERVDEEAEALLAHELTRAHSERIRPFIAALEHAVELLLAGTLTPQGLVNLTRATLRTRPFIVAEALRELDDMRARLSAGDAQKLVQVQKAAPRGVMSAARGVLLAAGFEPAELTEQRVLRILIYAPLVEAFHRSDSLA